MSFVNILPGEFPAEVLVVQFHNCGDLGLGEALSGFEVLY